VNPYSVYILKCADDTLYIGITNDMNRRFKEHNESKRGAHYTKIRRPVLLVYEEAGHTLSSARKREAELKRMTRAEKLELIDKQK
jgi:putative endonuclease